jgi:cell division protein FtsZ
LLNISSGTKEVTMDEVSIITDFIQQEAGLAADLIWGNCVDDSLGEKLSVTIIATGFQTMEERTVEKKQQRRISVLTSDTPLIKPVNTYIEPEEVSDEPVLKQEELQADLFENFFSHPSDQRPGFNDDIIKLPLVDDEHLEPKPLFEFELKTSESEEVREEEVEDVEEISSYNPDADKTDESIEDQLLKSKERILRLKDLSMKLRTANGLQELENEPAYKRKQMALEPVPHSSESQISRFTLSNDDGPTEIRPNNSFLHDNVD